MNDPLDAVFITGAELMKLRDMIDGYILLVDSAIKRLSDNQEETLTSATVKAAEEIAQLRARIDALENDIVCAFCGTHYKADSVPPQHYLTCEQSPLVQRIAEQARQLDEARALMDEITDNYIVSIDKDGLSYVNTNIIIDMIDFLVDNPANPAPQENAAQ